MSTSAIVNIREALHGLPSISEWDILGLKVIVKLHPEVRIEALSKLAGSFRLEKTPLEWRSILVFGEIDVPGGASPYLGLDIRDGCVLHIDVEDSNPIVMMNSSLEQFVSCFRAFSAASASDSLALKKVMGDVEVIDPLAFASVNEWRILVENLIDAGEA